MELGQAVLQGRQAKGIGDATEILAEMQNMTPGFGQTAAIPDGEGNGTGPATGYSGESWNAMKTKYIEAMKNVTDPRVLDGMMNQMADLEKGKVMEYGRLALAAMDQGDMETAQNYLAGVSFYTDPGVTPNISVQPDGTVLMATEGQKPMVMTKPQLEDFLHQYSNFEGYRDLAFDREQHKDMMEHREKQRLDAAADAAARRAIAEEELAARKEVWAADKAYDETRIAQLEQQMEHADLNLQAGATKAEQERITGVIDAANEWFDGYMEDPKPGTTKKDKSGGDVLGLEPEGPILDEKTQALIDASDAASEVLDADTRVQVADHRSRQQAIRRTLSDPYVQRDYRTIVSALAGGDKRLSGSEVGSIALSVIMSEGSGYDPMYDPTNGALVIQGPDGHKDYYKVHPAYAGLIGTMLDTVPQEQPQPAPNQGGGGIPEQQGP